MCEDVRQVQTNTAIKLCEDAGVTVKSRGFEIDDIALFQAHLSDYRINVVSASSMKSFIHRGPPFEKNLHIFC